MPDLTLLYDLEPREGLARAHRRGRGTVGRFEKAELEFHEDVRRAYLRIAKREPARVRVFDASQPVAALFRETWAALSERFGV